MISSSGSGRRAFGSGRRAEARRVRIRKSSTLARPVRLGRERTAGGRLVRFSREAGHADLDDRPWDLAASHREQRFPLVADVDGERARAQQVTATRQEAQQVHGVLPARRAMRADVRFQLLALAQCVAREGLVRPAGEERLAQGEEFAARVVRMRDEWGVQALQDVRVGPQGQCAEALQLPAELFVRGTVDVGRRFLEAPEERGGGQKHTPDVGVTGVRGQTEGTRAHDAGVDRVIAHQVLGAHADERRVRITPGESNFP